MALNNSNFKNFDLAKNLCGGNYGMYLKEIELIVHPQMAQALVC